MKLTNIFKKIKNNNKGVSLVEIIVAIAILGIATGPLIYTFVYTSRYNAMAKTKQRATSAAQTITENFKAYDLTEVYSRFTVKDADGNIVNPFLVNNTYATYSATGLYGTYTIGNMTLSDTDAKDTNKYDAVIDVTAGRSEATVDIPVFDPVYDAYFIETNETMGSYYYDPVYVASEIVSSDSSISSDDISEIKISRKISLAFSIDKATVTYSYPYVITYTAESGKSASSGTYSRSAKTIWETKDSSSIRDAYLYFYPAYQEVFKDDGAALSRTVKVTSDDLYISNTSGQEVDVFLYKQYDTSRTIYNLYKDENNYHLKVHASDSTVNPTNVYDCIGKNLSNDEVLPTAMMTPAYETYQDRVSIKNTTYPWSTEVLTYFVTVNIYDAAKDPTHTDPLATMTSTVVY